MFNATVFVCSINRTKIRVTMGFLRKIKANFRLRELKRIDERNFSSYDMTEIVESNSEGSVEPPKSDGDSKFQLQTFFESNQRSLPSEQFGDLSPNRSKRNSECASPVSTTDLSEKARGILSKAFPGVAFDDEFSFEDLLQYPDPEPSVCGSASSNEDDDDPSHEFFCGLFIDTSVGGNTPSKAGEDDEFLIESPKDAPVTSPKFAFEMTTSSVSPRQHKLAHIFHEELSTLYEGREDEGSLTSMEDVDAEQNISEAVSPKERSIHDRWSTILRMTIAGHCGHQVLIMDEAEI